jgi:allantoinase
MQPIPYSPIVTRPKLKWPNGARIALWLVPRRLLAHG